MTLEPASERDEDGALGRVEPLVLVVFGASGDLAARKILPALAALANSGQLPPQFVVVGVARSELDDRAFQAICRKAGGDTMKGTWATLLPRFRYVSGDYDDDATFATLQQLLTELDTTYQTKGNRLYYLATIPSLFGEVAKGLARHGLNEPAPGGSFARLVIEKPFGVDLESARALNSELHGAFREDQLFRIDHYMGKETVLNTLALRFANTIFEPIWNRSYVDHVQVTVAEDIGIEHRGNFYEHAGALRDIVQNHVMQVLALTLMEPAATFDSAGIRDEKVKLLRAMVIEDADGEVNQVVRGQYEAGVVDGEQVLGYRQEEGVDPKSQVETFVAMRLMVDNWRWAGVPVFVRTGKRLKRRATEVSMVFQRPPHLPFSGRLARNLRPDRLTLRIQPEEGVTLGFGAKVPGPAFQIQTVNMKFDYRDAFSVATAEAYERLLLDAMIGDAMLFIRSDEVDQAWKIVTPIQQIFAEETPPLARYTAGTWGPLESDRLIGMDGHQWFNF